MVLDDQPALVQWPEELLAGLPVLMLSGYGGPAPAQRARGAGIGQVLAKPGYRPANWRAHLLRPCRRIAGPLARPDQPRAHRAHSCRRAGNAHHPPAQPHIPWHRWSRSIRNLDCFPGRVADHPNEGVVRMPAAVVCPSCRIAVDGRMPRVTTLPSMD